MKMFDSETLCRMLFTQLQLPRAVAVAYSGGRDSSVLLHALMCAREQHDFALRALHFDHGLQPESAKWAAHCEATCRDWNIPFAHARREVVRQPGQNLEAQARRGRYQWFAECVEPGQALLTAHHADDQMETVLLNLLRGGGVGALAGIPQSRMLSQKKGTRVARPLLAISTAALAEYARLHDLRWADDRSNHSLQFDRNYLRHEIIPRLQRRRPGMASAIARTAAQCRDAAELIDATTLPLLHACETDAKRGVFCIAPPLDARALQMHPRARVITLLRLWLHRHGRHSPMDGQLRTLYAQVFESGCAHASLRCGQIELQYFNRHIYMTRQLEPGVMRCNDEITWDLRARNLGRGLRVEMRATDAANGLEQRRLHGRALRLVWRKGGERMTLPGRKHSSALKKLFQENAVPPWERRELPLFVVDGEIAWAHGIGAGAAWFARDAAGVLPKFAADHLEHRGGCV